MPKPSQLKRSIAAVEAAILDESSKLSLAELVLFCRHLVATLEHSGATWIDAKRERPDADITVLLLHPDLAEPVWPGFWDGEEWLSADNHIVTAHVRGWREFPAQPCEFPAHP